MVASGFVTAKYADVAEYNGITWSHKDLYGGHKWAGPAGSLCRYRRVQMASRPHQLLVLAAATAARSAVKIQLPGTEIRLRF